MGKLERTAPAEDTSIQSHGSTTRGSCGELQISNKCALLSVAVIRYFPRLSLIGQSFEKLIGQVKKRVYRQLMEIMEPERKKRRKELSVPKISDTAANNADQFLAEVLAAKRWMNSAPRCLSFLGDSESFRVVLQGIAAQRANIDQHTSGVPIILLRELVSFAANCCFYSTACQFEILKNPIVSVITDILNSDVLPIEEIKAPAARLISNFCSRKETASLVAQSIEIIPALTDVLTTPNLSNEQLSKFTLRALRLFADQGKNFRRSLLRNQTVHALAFFCDSQAKDSNLLKDAHVVLEKLISENANVAGKQISRTDFAQKIVDGGIENVMSVPMYQHLIEKSGEARNALTSAGILEMLAEEASLPEEDSVLDSSEDFTEGRILKILNFIICFSKDASGRAKIRSTGLFEIFVKALQNCSFGSSVLLNVLEALMNYVYDARSLEHLLVHHPFLDCVVLHFRHWLNDAPRHRCPGPVARRSGAESVDEFRPDSPSYLRIEKETALFTKAADLYIGSGRSPVLMRPPSSPSPEKGQAHPVWNAGGWSPSASSIGSYASMDSPRTSDIGGASSFCTADLLDSFNSSGVSQPSQETKAKPEETVESIKEKTLRQELFLLAWFSHSEQYLPKLCNPDLVQALVHYISRASDPDPRCGRILLRLARSRSVLELSLKAQLHIISTTELCNSELNAEGKQCPVGDFRDKILESMRSQAESSYGVGLLSHWLLSPTEGAQRLLAAMAIPYLISRGPRRRRLNCDTDFLKILLEAFTDDVSSTPVATSLLLLHSNDDPSSKMISNNQLGLRNCKFSPPPVESQDFITFQRKDPDPSRKLNSISVSRELMMKSSPYYESMFRGKFAESEVKEFEVDGEDFSFGSLVSFIHYLYGCRDSDCLRPDSSADLLGLLYLASKHCRTDLFDQIAASGSQILTHGDNFNEIFILSLMIEAKTLSIMGINHVLRQKSHQSLLALRDFTKVRGRDTELKNQLYSLLSAYL